MSNELPDDAITRQPTKPQGKWRKAIAGLPLLFLMLLVFAMVMRPGNSFIDGQTSGNYWLYFRFDKIWISSGGAIVITSAFGFVFTGYRKVLDQSFDWLDRVLMIMNAGLVVLGLAILFVLWPTTYANHLDTVNTGDHTYYLAERVNYSNTFQFWFNYLVFECDQAGVICQRIYESENQFYLKGSLEFDRSTGQLQLVDKGNVIYTYQVPH